MFTYRDITDEHVLDFAENARSHERALDRGTSAELPSQQINF